MRWWWVPMVTAPRQGSSTEGQGWRGGQSESGPGALILRPSQEPVRPVSPPQGSIVALVHDSGDAEDEENDVLLNGLSHQSHLILRAEGLATGFCRDVHGQVCGQVRGGGAASCWATATCEVGARVPTSLGVFWGGAGPRARLSGGSLLLGGECRRRGSASRRLPRGCSAPCTSVVLPQQAHV